MFTYGAEKGLHYTVKASASIPLGSTSFSPFGVLGFIPPTPPVTLDALNSPRLISRNEDSEPMDLCRFAHEDRFEHPRPGTPTYLSAFHKKPRQKAQTGNLGNGGSKAGEKGAPPWRLLSPSTGQA